MQETFQLDTPTNPLHSLLHIIHSFICHSNTYFDSSSECWTTNTVTYLLIVYMAMPIHYYYPTQRLVFSLSLFLYASRQWYYEWDHSAQKTVSSAFLKVEHVNLCTVEWEVEYYWFFIILSNFNIRVLNAVQIQSTNIHTFEQRYSRAYFLINHLNHTSIGVVYRCMIICLLVWHL